MAGQTPGDQPATSGSSSGSVWDAGSRGEELAGIVVDEGFHYLAAGRPVCGGCGQAPRDDFSPVDALRTVRLLGRRGEELLRQPDTLLCCHAPRGPRRTVLDLTAEAVGGLRAGISRLARLFESTSDRISTATIDVPGPRSPRAAGTVLASFVETAAVLVAAIDTIGAEAWDRPRPGGDTTAGNIVWLALHDATHHLEDADLAVPSALAGRSPE